jgi:hypothetical protein
LEPETQSAVAVAESKGILGDAKEQGKGIRNDMDDDDANECQTEEEVRQRAKVCFFRNFTLEGGDIRAIIPRRIASDTYRFKYILDKADRWRVQWQKEMFGARWFVDFVSQTSYYRRRGINMST